MSESVFNTQVYASVARKAQAEGIVMLENRDNALPLKKGSRIALFGRSQFRYYKSGTGSGGMVNTTYVTGVREAILEREAYVLAPSLEKAYEEWLPDHPFDEGCGWGTEPWFQEEMEPSEELVRAAAGEAEAAVVIIGRTAGEDQDNKPEGGSYYLTGTEETMLERVCAAFPRTIVLLNVGNIIDMKWVAKYRPAAVLYIWQGGQEGGNGVLDVLTGEVSPSGKLSDTIAYNISDYPSDKNFGDPDRNFYTEDIYVGYRYFETFAKEKVLYPFGFGLSYTKFEVRGLGMESAGDDTINFRVRVVNTGSVAGKEVVQIYCEAPQGRLGKPARVLCAYRKTIKLDPRQYQDLRLKVPMRAIASYDDSGVTGYKSCWVLEEGEYVFHLGSSVRDTKPCGSFRLNGTAPIEQLEEAMAPIRAFERMRPVRKADAAGSESLYEVTYEPVPLRTVPPLTRRAQRLPAEIPYTGDKGWRLCDVGDGKVSMDDFLAQLTDEDLICLTRGEGMCSPSRLLLGRTQRDPHGQRDEGLFHAFRHLPCLHLEQRAGQRTVQLGGTGTAQEPHRFPARPRHEHPQASAERQKLRVLFRGSFPHRKDGSRAAARHAREHGGRHDQAFLRQQPGVPPHEDGQRHFGESAQGDLPEGI